MDDLKNKIMENSDLLIENIDFDKITHSLRSGNFQQYFDLIETKVKESGKSQEKYILENFINDKRELEEFVSILILHGMDKAALILDKNIKDLTDLSRHDPENGLDKKFSFGHYNSIDTIAIGEESSSTGSYPMVNSPRGFCIIINNYMTKGTYKEMQRLRNIFFQLHFKVKLEKNLSSSNMIQYLKDISDDPALKYHNAIVILILSQGNIKGELLGFDGKVIEIGEIFSLFNSINCPSLRGKPRMFFFNCLRIMGSDEYSKGSELIRINKLLNGTLENYFSDFVDTIICYSAFDGYSTEFDPYFGTQFCRNLADNLVSNASNRDIVKILESVKAFLDKLDPGSIVLGQSCDKLVHFNPGTPEIKLIEPNR